MDALSNQKRKGLRVAFAVATAFTWAVATDDPLPFLSALFAAQMLISSSRAISLPKAGLLTLAILIVAAIVQFLTTFLAEQPPVLLLLLGLLYFACFLAQASGKTNPLIFLILVVSVMIPLLTILNIDLGSSILTVFVKSIAAGAVITWLAYALLPDIGVVEAPQVSVSAAPRPLWRAAADAMILLLALTLCLTQDRLATAVVIPITVASLLSQLDVEASGRPALATVVVNLMGGVAATLVFTVLEVKHSLLMLFLLVLFAGLVFGGRATEPTVAAKINAGALTVFLLVLGSGVSPLSSGAGETFATRVGYITLAIGYTLFFATLLWPSRRVATK
ncbi:DUF2955 domain-containing protein [Sinorhizobium sp. BG8]|uniref:DUF2955 domain-containing protein n=1 Tax=Sinorhizobium sp. BG8 TaxID=2613773 RepID=UPI00193EBDEB|nr:DUF2955 domain-containing protein [Sinorhizobium sp. BG8]QRM53807.1 DUF2955 domain-containing protein [Sinorhizobium sp. BG8]